MKRKGWIVLASVIVGWLWCAPAWTCDDQGGKCKVEDWRWYSSSAGMLMIEGSTTCDKGRIRFRLYEGTGDKRKFIGVDSGFIEGHTFEAVMMNIQKPKAPSIKYSIEPGN